MRTCIAMSHLHGLNDISSTLWQALIIVNRNVAGTGMSPRAAQTNSCRWWTAKCSVSTLGFIQRSSELSFVLKPHHQAITDVLIFSTSQIYFLQNTFSCNNIFLNPLFLSCVNLLLTLFFLFFIPVSDDIDGVPQ